MCVYVFISLKFICIHCAIWLCGCCYCRQSAGWWQQFFAIVFCVVSGHADQGNTGENLHHVITINNSQLNLYSFSHESVHQLQLPCLRTITCTHTLTPKSQRPTVVRPNRQNYLDFASSCFNYMRLTFFDANAPHKSEFRKNVWQNTCTTPQQPLDEVQLSPLAHSRANLLVKFFKLDFFFVFFCFRCSPIAICRISLVFSQTTRSHTQEPVTTNHRNDNRKNPK